MKCRRFLLLLFIMIFLVACKKQGVENKQEDEPQTVTETPSVPDSDEDDSDNTDNRMENGISLKNIEFTVSASGDRVFVSAEWVLGHIDYAESDPEGVAVCLVTLMGADTDNCSEDTARPVVVKIRIDRIIRKNASFSEGEGEIIETSDLCGWRKRKDGYAVVTQGNIPVTETGAQYIVYLYEKPQLGEDFFGRTIKYRMEGYTIPISNTLELSTEEIYERMHLEDDYKKCSEELIKLYINQ